MLVPFLTLVLLVFLVRGIYRDYPDDMLEEEIETETISSLLAPIAGIAIINIADIILKAFGISNGGCACVFYHRETKVMYIISYDGVATVMLNSDGTPQLYNG